MSLLCAPSIIWQNPQLHAAVGALAGYPQMAGSGDPALQALLCGRANAEALCDETLETPTDPTVWAN